MTQRIEELVVALSHDPFNPEFNFAVANEYRALNQTASAVSFYLRTVEYGQGVLVYNSLLRMAQCFNDQNDRVHTVTNCLLQAIAYMPERQEAYFMMSQFYEHTQQWQECYTWSCLGLDRMYQGDLPADIGYKGEYCLLFEKAISAWWIGRKDESKELLIRLSSMSLSDEYKNSVKYNMERLGIAAV